jgi:hypothetical protein
VIFIDSLNLQTFVPARQQRTANNRALFQQRRRLGNVPERFLEGAGGQALQ